RDLMRLGRAGFVETATNPPNADPRRIPYHISDRGRQAFDTWLTSPTRGPEEIENWLLFMDRVPLESRIAILERYRDDLIIRNKLLARERDDALQALRRDAETADAVFPLLLTRRLKRIACEIEFVDEVIQPLLAEQARVGASVTNDDELHGRAPIRARRP